MGWLDSIISTAGNAFGLWNQQENQNNYYDMLQRAEQERIALQQRQSEYDAQVAALMQSDSGGGGGGSNGITSEMMSVFNDYMDKALGMYQPYADAGAQVLPQATKAYEDALGGVSGLLSAYSTPEGAAKLSQSRPAYSIPMNIPGGYRK